MYLPFNFFPEIVKYGVVCNKVVFCERSILLLDRPSAYGSYSMEQIP